MMRIIFLFLIPLGVQAQSFNNRLSVQGFLKSGGAAIHDLVGFPMKFVIKRNSTIVWCQQSPAHVPVANGVFSSILSGLSDCESLTNALDAVVFQHTSNSDLFLIDVVVDTSKDGFGSADDATFAGIDLVPTPMSMSSFQAEQAKTLVGTLSVASGGTGATTAATARANLGLGSVSTISTSGNATHVLLGNGTFAAPPAPVSFTGNLLGDVTGTQSATTVTRIRGRNVSTVAPTDGQVMTWNDSLSEWQATTPVSAPVATVAGKTGDVTLVSSDISDATSASTASTLVIRDTSGNFSANSVTATTFESSSGGTTNLGNNTSTSLTQVRLGSTGVAFAAMGACTIASAAISTTATSRTCTGVPASTAVSVYCSATAALTNPNTNSLYCRASGAANTVVCNTVAANSVNTTYVCMWMQP